MNLAFVSAGSNINPKENLENAEKLLKEKSILRSSSSTLQTKPFGKLDQADFLDKVFFIQTELSLDEFKMFLKEIENKLGRIRSPENKYGPLTLDLDILVWNGKIIKAKEFNQSYIIQLIREIEPSFNHVA